ncbi:hypothetical protein MSIBF_A1340007 [groundwater metagenome]|uniref:Uncharacterized protein n=1 Tax=groundwater metagenome TaxID=717931 RepID=A0A098E616_9ZZZZ
MAFQKEFLKSPSNSEVILFLAFYKSKDAAKFNLPFLNRKDLKISEQQRGQKSKTQNFSSA